MKLLAVHPSGLMYTRVFLTLEPLGLELVAGAARAAGHDVRIVDLQVEHPRRLWRLIDQWRPDAVCLGGNYLANVPEIIDTAKAIKNRRPDCFVFVGGHSASFVAADLLAHGAGAIDCVIKGEGETAVPLLLQAIQDGARPDRRARRDQRGRRGAAAPLRREPRYHPPGARPAGQTAALLHRHARSLRLDRVRPRLPMGLHVLQRLDLLRPQLPRRLARGDRRGTGRHPRTRRVHRRRRRLRACQPRLRDRRGDQTPRHPQGVLPRDARRRPAAQHGRVPVLARPRPEDHVHRPGGDRRGRAATLPQADRPRSQHGSAGGGPFARYRRRHQPDRRPVLGSRTLRDDPAVVPGNPRGGEHQRHHALSRHRDLADRGAQADHPRLPAVRHPARRAADHAAAAGVLRRTGQNPAGAEPQASGFRRNPQDLGDQQPGCCCTARPISCA